MSRKTRTDRGGARGRSRRTKILINSFLVGALALTAGGTTTGTVSLLAADGTTTVTTVTVGVQGGSTTEIVSGVSEGDEVVVSLDTAVGTTTTTTQQGGMPSGMSGGMPTGGFAGGPGATDDDRHPAPRARAARDPQGVRRG